MHVWTGKMNGIRAALTALAVAAAVSGATVARASGEAAGGGSVAVPRRWLEARRALELAGRAGLRHAVTAREVEGLVGPFSVDQAIPAGELAARAARAAGLELSWRGGAAVLQPPAPAGGGLSGAIKDLQSPDAGKRRRAAFALGQSLRLDAVPALIGALGEADSSVRRVALLALAAFEGDFDRGQWAGRVSIFELDGVKLDTDSLLWVAEEGAPAGGDEWEAAVSILARAREPQLSRALWSFPWNRTPGAIMPVIRAVGRCGDPDVRRMLEKRIRNTFTDDGADRFASAAAMGKLGMVASLRNHLVSEGRGAQPPMVRCAAVYGLGFCSGCPDALAALIAALADPDARVREMAVFALGEMDTVASAEALAGILADEKGFVALRAAAGVALARASGHRGLEPLLAAAGSSDARVRAAVAEALGDLGGLRAQRALAAMIEDDDRYVVAAAGRALAAIGPLTSGDARGDAASDRWAGFGALLLDPKTDQDVRIAVAVGLGQGHDPAAARFLEAVALDPAAGHRLRRYAARSLVRLAGRAGHPALRKLIEAAPPARLTDVPLRYLDLGDAAETTAYLARWLTAGTPDEQSLAAERIGEIGTPEGMRLLVGAFNVFDNHARFTQVWSLMRSEHPDGHRKLIDLLRASRRSGVRMNAALALSGRRDPDAVDALIAACGDESPAVRKAAANALGECGDARAAPALIMLMERDTNVAVANQALRALRMREFAGLPAVREAFERVRGTERDRGVPGDRPSLVDQPANSWVLRHWASDIDDDTIPNLTYESALVWDAAGRRIVQWGSHGRHADSPQTGMTWFYDSTGVVAWHRPEPRQEPPGICLTRGIVADPVRALLISPAGVCGGHGWVMALRRHAGYSVPWLFDSRAEQWMPAHTLFHPGNANEATACFDLRNDVMLLNSHALVYDPHVNQWVQPPTPPADAPERERNAPGAYDPISGRFLMVAGADARGRARTWAYDLPANRWTDLAAENGPLPSRAPMVYDSVNDVMLLFRPEGNRTAVWAYYPRENRWQELPAVHPSPSYREFDVAYDPLRNVAVMSGGWEWGQSGAVTVRETWTYRYRPATPTGAVGRLGPPEALKLDLSADGVTLSWSPPASGAPTGYHVWRGVGAHPWTAKFQRLTTEPLKTTTFMDTGLAPTPGQAAWDGQSSFYRVAAVGADGEEGLPSNLARTRPEAVREVFCARDVDGTVRVAWTPSRSPGVIGYNVYRAPSAQPDLWQRTFDAARNERAGNKRVRLTDKPIQATEFRDRPDADASPSASESNWAPLFVYVVTAVNHLGQESGPSPATLSIPAAPGPVTAVPLEDGRFLAISGDAGPLTAAERGRWLYRMDAYKADWAFRARGAPHPGVTLVDDSIWPLGDRRAYFVIATDGTGQLGAPSTESWALGMP